MGMCAVLRIIYNVLITNILNITERKDVLHQRTCTAHRIKRTQNKRKHSTLQYNTNIINTFASFLK